MKEKRDGEGKRRSWWTAVGLFTLRKFALLQMFSSTHRKGRESEGQERRGESNRGM